MASKLVFSLFLFQFWHYAMPNSTTVNDFSQLDVSNRTTLNVKPIVSTTTNFPLQIGNKFYHVEDNLKTNWHQAAHNCRNLGGHLINFETNAEMDAILAAVPTSRYWTSANCLGKNREWISISTGMPMPFLKWINKEPNNMLELCVELKITALNDAFCNLSFNYICEAKVI